jgi:hypothetical protein
MKMKPPTQMRGGGWTRPPSSAHRGDLPTVPVPIRHPCLCSQPRFIVLVIVVAAVPVVVVPSRRCRPAPSSPLLSAPRLHPASSCSRRWYGVLLWSWPSSCSSGGAVGHRPCLAYHPVPIIVIVVPVPPVPSSSPSSCPCPVLVLFWRVLVVLVFLWPLLVAFLVGNHPAVP